MLEIIISGQPTGKKALMYSEIGRQGRRRLVPTYGVNVIGNDRMIYQFAVTRLARDKVFNGGQPHDYGPNNECPPSRLHQPYHGRITTAGRLGFAIMLYDLECLHRETLWGQGSEPRKGIKIHYGPATSLGCMAIVGGAVGYKRFVQAFQHLRREYGDVYRVTVLERTK